MAASQISETVPEFDESKIPVEGQPSPTFRANAGYAWGRLKDIVLSLNIFSGQLNTIANEVDENTTLTALNKQYVQEARTVVENTMATMPDGSINDTEASNTSTYSSQKINNDFAKKNGDNTQKFKTANGEENDDAATLGQLNGAVQALNQSINNAVGGIVTLPIGFQSYEVIESPRANQLVQGGGEFLRADYPLLWAFIQTQTSLLKTEAQWQEEATANGGVCGYYSSGDDATTFRLPNHFGATIKIIDGVSRLVGSYEADQNKSHTHTGSAASNGAHTHTVPIYNPSYSIGNIIGAGNPSNPKGDGTTSSSGAHQHTLTINREGGTENTVKNIGGLSLIIAL